jgi:NADH-quinone oxidoreductase subunit C
MADDPKVPVPQTPPPISAADKPASALPGAASKGEMSPADAGAPKPGAAPPKPPAAVPPKPPAGAVAKPAAAAAKPAAPSAEHAAKAAPPTGPPDPPPPSGKTQPSFIASLEAAIPGSVTQVSYWVGDWTIIVPAVKILAIAKWLREMPEASFDMCSDLTATDWPPRAERFDVVYCLYSSRHRHRVRVKARLAESQPIASVTPVWPSANWLEREVLDMFGISFAGHPDPRRILMPQDWQGHPQRKDYPLEGPGELLMENPIDWLKLRQAREETDIE